MPVAERVRAAFSDPTLDALFAVLAACVLLDFATTTVIFLTPAYEEGNQLLTSLASVHVSLALAYNLGYGVVLVGAYCFAGGWLGRVGAVVSLTSGFLGVNNLLYFALGDPALIYVLFGDAVPVVLGYGIPALGLVAGTAWHLARGNAIPWRVVAVALAVGGLSDLVPELVLS